MSVSELMKLSENFSNNIRHKYSIKIDGIETSDFVFDRNSISMSDTIKAKSEDKFQPSTMTINFEFRSEVIEGSIVDLSKQSFFSSFIRDLRFSSTELQGWPFNQQKDIRNLQVKDIFKLGLDVKITGSIDNITYDIFSGSISEVEFTKTNTGFTAKATMKSNLIKSYTRKFDKDEVLVDWYICNNSVPGMSLLHRWAIKMGYVSYDFVDIKYPDGSYVQIPYVNETEEESIISSFSELVRSFNGVMRVEDDKIIVRKYGGVIFPVNMIANEKGIYQPFSTKDIDPDMKKVKVTFDQYSYSTDSIVWALKGENGTVNSANVLVTKNTPLDQQDLRWVIEWQPSGLVQEWRIEQDDVKAYKVTGQQPPSEPEYVDLEYELIEVSGSGGYIKFYNTKDYDIVIERFKIRGNPITKSSGNTFSFTKVDENNITDSQILEKNNKFVQTIKHARYYAQLIYNTECEPYQEVSFKHNHCMGYLKAGSNIFIRHNLLPELEVIVDELKHNGNEAEIKATTYQPFKYSDNLGDIVIDQGANDEDIKTDEAINNGGLMGQDRPSAPIGFMVISSLKALTVRLEPPNEKIVKGFNIYFKELTATSWNKTFTGNRSTVLYDMDPKKVYQVRATCVSYQDKESDFTITITEQPRDFEAGDIVYPPGQSPDELDKVIGDLSNQIAKDIERLEGADKMISDNLSDVQNNLSGKIEDLDEYLGDEIERVEKVVVEKENGIFTHISKVEKDLEGKIEANTTLIEVTEEGIKATIQGIEGDVLDLDGRITKNSNEIIATKEEFSTTIKETITDLKDGYLDKKFTQIKATTDGISATVSSNKEDIDGKISTVNAQLLILDGKITTEINQLNIDALKKTVEDNSSKIEQMPDKITSTVSTSISDLKENYIEKNYSTIEQTSNSINLAVQAMSSEISDATNPTNLVSQINIAPEGVQIKGQSIKLNDGFRVNADGSVDVANLNADWITSGNIDADKVKITNLKVGEISGMNDFKTEVSLAQGEMMYIDPLFAVGHNGIAIYDNNGTGQVIHDRITGNDFGQLTPTNTNMVLKISKANGINASPGMGGFTFLTLTRSGGKFITKLTAWIPTGHKINWASNTIGDGGTHKWLTDTAGQSNWAEYICEVTCGTSGSFSTTNFYYLTADDGNNAKAITWGLCFATVYDMAGNSQRIASEVKDAIDNGEVVINSNTMFTGNAKFISSGTDTEGKTEETEILAGRIIFKKDKIPITVLRNMRWGQIATDSKGTGKVDFSDMSQGISIFPTIASFSVPQAVRGITCTASKVAGTTNTYAFTLGGNMEQSNTNNATQTFTMATGRSTFTKNSCTQFNLSKISFTPNNNTINAIGGDLHSYPKIKVIITYNNGAGSSSVVYSNTLTVPITKTYSTWVKCSSSYGTVSGYKLNFGALNIDLNITSPITTSLTNKSYYIDITVEMGSYNTKTYSLAGGSDNQYCKEASNNTYQIGAGFTDFTITGSTGTTTVSNLTGSGTVHYLVVENV